MPLTSTLVVPTIFVSRSSDGLHWSNPVSIPQGSGPVNLDKNWTVSDNTPASSFYGKCCTEFDNFATFDLEVPSTSSDGGQTWSVPVSTPTQAHGLGGQPPVQHNGNVVVPFESIDGLATIASFGSTDGGASLTDAVTVAPINFHKVAGDLRTSPLPSAEIDASGNVFVAWEDCTFESGCPSNDIVYSTSSDGTNWSPVTLVPIDPTNTSVHVDHFIPGFGVDRSTSDGTASIGLTYYFYPNANCTTTGATACELDAGFISSSNGGKNWSVAQQLAGPMTLTWLAFTTQGYMVGDYIATTFSGGLAFSPIAVASAGTPTQNLNEAMFVDTSGLSTSSGTLASTTQGAGRGVSRLSFVVGPTNR